MADNKVRFGVSNARYALETDSGFGSWKRVPGSVQIQIEPQESMSEFYADNILYYAQRGSANDTVTIEVADLTDEALIDLVGYVEDETAGGLALPVNAVQKPFALAFQVEGSETTMRICIYGGKLNRPSNTYNTIQDTVEPSTMSIEGRFSGKTFTVNGEDVPYLYFTAKTGDTGFDSFFTTVPEPGKAPA